MTDLIGNVPADAASTFGDRVALVFEGREFSFLEIHELVERTASGLARLGIGSGDVVTLYATNSWQYLISYYATYRVGAVLNPVISQIPASLVEYFVADCGAKTIIASSDVVGAIVGLKDRTDVTNVIAIGDVVPDGALSFDTLIDHDLPPVPQVNVDPQSLAAICYTSGTTGKPKGVMLSHQAVLMNAIAINEYNRRGPKDCSINALPLPHVYSTAVINTVMLAGYKMVLHAGFNPATVLAEIEAYGATIIDGVPAMYLAMMHHPDMAQTDVSSLRVGFHAGAPMSVPAVQGAEAAFGVPFYDIWGMTEMAGAGSSTPTTSAHKHGTSGYAVPNCEVRIVDPHDAETILPTGEVGELMFRGPVVMMGYYKNEDATAEVLRLDGWMHTGDIATIDADGCITIVDRKKDMLIVGGSNVYPTEVEAVLAAHPDLAQCAVGHLPHPILGQVPKAYVVAKPGTEISEADVIAFCDGKLPEYKVPRTVQVVEDLPKNATGKVLRRMLQGLDLPETVDP